MIYIVPYAMTTLDIDIVKASALLTIMGVTELIGRPPWGAVADLEWVNPHYLCAFLTLALRGISSHN